MIRISRPSGPDPSELAWSRVVTHAGKLLESLKALGEAGGACKAAAAGRWSLEAHDAAMGRLLAVVEAAEGELGRLEMRRRHFPSRAQRLG